VNSGISGRAGPPGPPTRKDGEDSLNIGVWSGGPSGPALPQRKKLPHGVPSWVADGTVYFITICCVERGRNQLCEPAVAEQIFEAIRFRWERYDWYARLVLLMPDHLHGLISFSPRQPMTKIIANFKEIVAKKTGVRWQRDYFDHRLRSDESLDEKAHYIRVNPVRKGLIARAEDWPYVWPRIPDAAAPAVPPYL
jgi:REP element-mobilizing transposase RayT